MQLVGADLSYRGREERPYSRGCSQAEVPRRGMEIGRGHHTHKVKQ